MIIEEGTPFYEIYGERPYVPNCEYPPLPDEDCERQMYYDTKRILTEYGYRRYEISNYAKPGYECRHNLGYWNRTEYLGFGDGAASFMDHKRWVAGGKPNLLTIEDEMEEYMFLGLRKTEGVSIPGFEKQFGKAMETVYKKVLADMESKQLLERQEDFIRLTERGIDVSNYVMSEFLL